MIVVDSSALVAVLEHEIDAAVYARPIERADRLRISAVNVHETGIFCAYGAVGRRSISSGISY
jgi:uncharacterized protein with PIN domain